MKLLVKVPPHPWDWLKLCVIARGSHRYTHTYHYPHTHALRVITPLRTWTIDFLPSFHQVRAAREYGNERLVRKIKLSLLLSSLPPFSPSLQTDDRSNCCRSLCCFSSVRHHSITSPTNVLTSSLLPGLLLFLFFIHFPSLSFQVFLLPRTDEFSPLFSFPSPHPSFLNSPKLCTINQLPLLHPSFHP